MKNLLNVEAGATAATPAKTTRMLLRLVRAAQPISRIELARRLQINRSTVTDIFNPLIKAGILREERLETVSGASRTQGRPRIGVSFNDSKEFFVGVNLGVRHSQVGLTTLSGKLLAETEFETPSEPTLALEQIQNSIKELSRKADNRKLKVIGVSVPGVADSEQKCLLYAPHLGWRDVAVADALQNTGEPNVPVIVENDATAAAMYEARLKLQKTDDSPLKNFVLLRSGTGIGVGLVIEGEVYRGTEQSEGFAGEFGHMTIVAGGKLCVCGNRGCWERYAAASAAPALYTGDRAQTKEKQLRFVEIVGRAEAGETKARRTLERIGEYLGIGIGNVITGLGVPNVILSGRLVYGWKFIKPTLFKAVDASLVGKLNDWTIECGEPKGSAIGGALEVAVEEYLMRGLKF